MPSVLELSSSFSSQTPSEHEQGSSVASSPWTQGSGATTPEPSSPHSLSKDDEENTSVALLDHRAIYDESELPVIPKTEPVQPLLLDAQTPDHWIARDERMVRLTGKHPYNVEAPLSALFNGGFLTPQNLFYVRTHGDTPRVTRQQAQDWRLRVHGLVENEFEFSIQDLKDRFPVVTLPVTLVCAGNRRKEQNMVTKGLGFNWGAAGVSTGLFTGVYLADVLDYCKPKNPLNSSYPLYDTAFAGRSRHVIFEGVDKLLKGKYGTSQRLKWAMDHEKGMLICWGLNGEDLSADHGYPLRLVVPGQIGGRMVKWLQRIEVSDRESQHYLHFFDNKLLPTEVSADQARNEDKWWYDPKYIINDLNVNAAICSPDHGQLLKLSSGSGVKQVLPIEGYAYTGGGRRITRVEITFDDGQTWKLADITFPEDLYRLRPIKNHPYFGELDLSMTEMSFSWCFWRFDTDVQAHLVDCDVKVIAVRAMDEALSIMPRDMYWNAMSMMNSWWFRVAVHKENDGGTLRFEHPTLAGTAAGGWMQRMTESGKTPRYPYFDGESPYSPAISGATGEGTMAAAKPKGDERSVMLNPDKISTVITASELAEHADGQGPTPWFVVHGHVYDGTGFLQDHPGGDQSIRLVAGEDATEDFMGIHSKDAKLILRDFHLGKLEETSIPGSTAQNLDGDSQGDPSKPFLEQKRWKTTRLVSRKHISHDSRIFRFALSHGEQELGLPIGQHVYLRVKKTNKMTGEVETVQRAYTPYSGNTQRGFVDILIKVYFPAEASNQTFPGFAGGKMTMVLENIPLEKVSKELIVEIKGPLGHFTYLGDSQVQLKPGGPARKVNKLAMIAGGSGITPIWSTLKAIADEYISCSPSQRPEPIEIWIVYGNRHEKDILIREELDRLLLALDGSLNIWHVLSSHKDLDDSWKMGRGHVNLECLRQHLPPPVASSASVEMRDTLALVCGPPPMEKAVTGGLEKLGWDIKEDVVFF